MDVSLVQIKEIAGLLEGAITSTMVTLASVRQQLGKAATELGEDFAMDIGLAVEELDNPVSTYLGHVLRLKTNYCNSLLEKRRKKELSKLRGNKTKPVDTLNREYPPCLGSLFKGM